MASLNLWLPTLVSFCAAAAVTALLVQWMPRWRMMDRPNERSSHEKPTPRGGGLGILVGVALAVLTADVLGIAMPSLRLLGATMLVAVVGLWDDRAGETPWWARLALHLGAAAWVVWPAGGLERLPLPAPLDFGLGPLAVPVAVVWIAAVLNFFNFMDGIDGIAGLQLVATALALGACLGGAWAWLGPALAAGAAGFLLFNWHPAKIFLGDVGSCSLGFLLAAAPFAGGRETPREGVLLVGVSLFLFLGDALWTLLQRIRRRERLSQAHRTHLYQRLGDTGLDHAQVARAVGLGAAILSVLAVWAFGREEVAWVVVLGAAVALLVVEILWVRRRERAAALRG